MSDPRQSVFCAISDERAYQDVKWGTIKDRPHNIAEWILIAEAELNEAKKAWTKECSDQRALEELLQTAAVLVAALEQYSVQTYSHRREAEFNDPLASRDGDRHYSLHYTKLRPS